MKKKAYIIIIIIVSAIALGRCLKNIKDDKINNQFEFIELAEKRIKKLEQENSLNIENQIVYLGNDSLNSINLFELTDDILFFYFSNNTCTPCIEGTISIIKKYIPNYEKNSKIIFISPYSDPQYKQNYYGKELLSLSKNKLGIPLEDENVPFFFMLDQNLKVDNLHIVNKNNFEKTNNYVNRMEKTLNITEH